MRRLLSCLVLVPPLVVAGSAAAFALSLPIEEQDYLPPEDTTTYVERSLNRQAPLTIEHPQLPPRTGGSAAMAGFCHPAGTIRRRTEEGLVVLRQREVCENIAPRTLYPGQIDQRPTWPARTWVKRTRERAVIRKRALVSKG